MSREVTSLLLGLPGWGLGLGLGLGLRRGSRSLVVLVLRHVVVLVFLYDPRDVHDQIAGRLVHDLRALRVAAGNSTPLDQHADHDSLLGHPHELVAGRYLCQRADLAVLVAALQRNDASPAA